MAGITKQKRSYMNKPIGVTRFETGETQMWESVANAANQLNQIALNEGAKQAEQSGMDAAMAMSQANLIAFDAETGVPKALDPSLFSGGIIAREAYNRIIQSRFGKSIEEELKNKAAELQIKNPYNPAKFREEMSRYVGEMHKNAQGKWKETIKVAGTSIVNSTGLYIESQAKIKSDAALGQSILNSSDDTISNMFNILNANGFEIGSLLALDEMEEKYSNLKDAETAGKGFIVSAGTAEVFRRKYLTNIGIKKLQHEFNNPENLINTKSNGNNNRLNILAALEAQNSEELNPTEKLVYDKIFKFVEEQPDILKNIARESRPFILNQNQQAIDQDVQTMAITLSAHSENIKEQNVVINGLFGQNLHKGNLLTVANMFEQLKQELRMSKILNANSATYEQDVGIANDNLNNLKETVSRNIINKLVLGKGTTPIAKIRAILKNPGADISHLSNNDQELINLFHKEQLTTANFASIFTTASAIYAGDQGIKVDKQTNDSWNLSGNFQSFANINNYETVLKKSKELLALTNTDLKDLGATSKTRYENAIQQVLLDKSGRRMKFSSVADVLSAQAYLLGTEDALDELPEVKTIIDESKEMLGFTPDSFNSIFAQRKQIHSANDARKNAEAIRTQIYNEINEGFGTKEKHKKLATEILNNVSNNQTHRQNITSANNPDYINALDYLITKQVMPDAVSSVFKNVANNLGDYNFEEVRNVLSLYRRYSNGIHLENASPVDFMSELLDSETIAIFEVASTISESLGEEKALDFMTRTAQINSGEFNENIANVLGIESASNDNIETFISGIDISFIGQIGQDIIKDTIAKENFTELVKYAALSGMNAKAIKTMVGKRFESMFVETEGYVKDFGNSNSNFSRHALKKVFPEKELKETFINKVSEDLSLLGYVFGDNYPPLEKEDIQYKGSIGASLAERNKKRFPNGKAVLIPLGTGTQEVMYMAYKQDQTTGELTLIRHPINEFGDVEPLIFSNREGYLKITLDKIRKDRLTIDADKASKAQSARERLKKLQEFRSEDAKKISIMNQAP